MLKFVSYQFKTKNLCKNAVNKFPYVLKYARDGYKTKEICDKVITENCRILRFILGCFEDQVIKVLIIIFML